MPKVNVEFDISNELRFEQQLQQHFEHDDNVIGLRSDTSPAVRAPLRLFADAMEAKLKKHDNKTHWRELPVEALFKMLLIEIEEFKVSQEYLTVAEARSELVDVANYALILWDRMSLEPQSNVKK